jgi:hypothetical protein
LGGPFTRQKEDEEFAPSHRKPLEIAMGNLVSWLTVAAAGFTASLLIYSVVAEVRDYLFARADKRKRR